MNPVQHRYSRCSHTTFQRHVSKYLKPFIRNTFSHKNFNLNFLRGRVCRTVVLTVSQSKFVRLLSAIRALSQALQVLFSTVTSVAAIARHFTNMLFFTKIFPIWNTICYKKFKLHFCQTFQLEFIATGGLRFRNSHRDQ